MHLHVSVDAFLCTLQEARRLYGTIALKGPQVKLGPEDRSALNATGTSLPVHGMHSLYKRVMFATEMRVLEFVLHQSKKSVEKDRVSTKFVVSVQRVNTYLRSCCL